MSNRIKNAHRRYTIEMILAMALYIIVLFGSLTFAKGLTAGPLLTILALTPVIPMVLAVIAFFRLYTRMDERQRRINANAAALTLMVAILTAITLGFLRRFGVFAFDAEMIWFGPFLIITWGLTKIAMGDRC